MTLGCKCVIAKQLYWGFGKYRFKLWNMWQWRLGKKRECAMEGITITCILNVSHFRQCLNYPQICSYVGFSCWLSAKQGQCGQFESDRKLCDTTTPPTSPNLQGHYQNRNMICSTRSKAYQTSLGQIKPRPH